MSTLPPLSLVRQLDTHRLIPSRHRPKGDSVLVDIADDDGHLQAIFELDAATNERLLAAQQLLRGAGFSRVWSLKGGVDEWARQVDPAMRRY